MSSPDILERIAETAHTRLTDQERGHLMDAAHLIRTLQARNEEVCNLYLAAGRESRLPASADAVRK